jgi:excisionase family DNA binding protein
MTVKGGILGPRDTRVENPAVIERIFYRITEVSELIGCSKSKAYQLVQSGAIPSTRIGSLLRVPRSALEAFVNRTGDQSQVGDGEAEE